MGGRITRNRTRPNPGYLRQRKKKRRKMTSVSNNSNITATTTTGSVSSTEKENEKKSLNKKRRQSSSSPTKTGKKLTNLESESQLHSMGTLNIKKAESSRSSVSQIRGNSYHIRSPLEDDILPDETVIITPDTDTNHFMANTAQSSGTEDSDTKHYDDESSSGSTTASYYVPPHKSNDSAGKQKESKRTETKTSFNSRRKQGRDSPSLGPVHHNEADDEEFTNPTMSENEEEDEYEGQDGEEEKGDEDQEQSRVERSHGQFNTEGIDDSEDIDDYTESTVTTRTSIDTGEMDDTFEDGMSTSSMRYAKRTPLKSSSSSGGSNLFSNVVKEKTFRDELEDKILQSQIRRRSKQQFTINN